MTVDGRVIAADSRESYPLPADIQRIQVRAPGYRAAVFTVLEASRENGRLSLNPFAVHALYLTEYGITSKTLRTGAVNILRGKGPMRSSSISRAIEVVCLIRAKSLSLAAWVLDESLQFLR